MRTHVMHTEHIKCTRLERKVVYKLKRTRMRTKRIRVVTQWSSEIALIQFPCLATSGNNNSCRKWRMKGRKLRAQVLRIKKSWLQCKWDFVRPKANSTY